LTGFSAAWREVKQIVIGLASLIALTWLLNKRWLMWGLLGLLGWVFYFFRDPERDPASEADDLLVAPADGRITEIVQVKEPLFFDTPVQRITIFLSLFDVHVQRIPYTGVVKKISYQPGKFTPAFLKHADENEANFIGLETKHGPLAIKQMTGILARRIECWVDPDEQLQRGQRVGLIKFGSRVDIFLPPEAELLVHVGQQVYGGKTIIGRWLTTTNKN